MIYVILMDRKAPAKSDVQEWLRKTGYIAWSANDVSHAIEELSDYTVQTRPGVVMLEVSSFADSFDTLRSTFDMSPNGERVTLLALGSQGFSDGMVADNINQLAK